jgi:hypothetical protein
MKEYFRKPYMTQGITKHSDYMKAIPERAITVQGQIAPNIEFKKPYDFTPNTAQMIHYYSNSLSYLGGDPVPPLSDPSLLPHAPVIISDIPQGATNSFYPTSINDECFWQSWGSGFSYFVTTTVIGYSTISGDRSAFRFPNISIPNGATIKSAIITFYAGEFLGANTCNVKLYCNDVSNAVAPTSAAIANALLLTAAYVEWNSLPAWSKYSSYNTPQLKSILQPIVNRETWGEGNALMVVVHNNGSTADAIRLAYAFDANLPAYYPKLKIEWEKG